jgi:NADH dehydrogenase
LVVGATGLLGFEICKQLRARNGTVRALVRAGASKEEALRALGCDIAFGDLKDRATLDAACCGVTAVATTANAVLSRRRGDSLKTVDRDGHLSLIAAARAAAVGRFIYVSLDRALPANNPLVKCKREIERAVRESGMKWTILQPSAFMEIHAGTALGWDFAKGRARVMGSGRARMDYVAVEDVAQLAAESVLSAATEGRHLQIAGPERLTPLGAVAIAERITGLHFEVRRIPSPALHVLRWLLRPLAPIPSSLIAMAVAMETAHEDVDMTTLLHEFPIHQTSFADYVRGAQRAAADAAASR